MGIGSNRVSHDALARERSEGTDHSGIDDGKDNQFMGYKELKEPVMGHSHINIWGE